MDKMNITIFVGKYLTNFRTVTAADVQRFILNNDAVGKAIDVNDIESTLDDLQFAGFLDVVKSGVYRKSVS